MQILIQNHHNKTTPTFPVYHSNLTSPCRQNITNITMYIDLKLVLSTHNISLSFNFKPGIRQVERPISGSRLYMYFIYLFVFHVYTTK